MKKLKNILKHWPGLYQGIQRIYYALRRVLEYILGTGFHEWLWRHRHVGKGRSWTESYTVSLDHPHRFFLIDRIRTYAPFQSVLEIGCNTGPNLFLLSGLFPEARFYGIDINPQAVRDGRRWLQEKGLGNVSLEVGKADDLSHFSDKSIDIVFTDAILIYVGADKIDKVISEIKRVARKAVIFLEWNLDDEERSFQWYDSHWIYNYRKLLSCHFTTGRVDLVSLPGDLWDDPSWKTYGAVAEVALAGKDMG